MTAASPNHQSSHNYEDAGSTTIDVIDVSVISPSKEGQGEPDRTAIHTANPLPSDSTPAPDTNSSALVTTTGGGPSFSNMLAVLTPDTFRQVVSDVEQKLEVVNQTLSMLDIALGNQGFDKILQEMLSSITLKTGELLGADRTTIWLLDEDKNELWSIVAKGEDGRPLELRIPADKGISGEVATFRKTINIPFDFYDDPRSESAKAFDKRNNYRTYTTLTMPLMNEEKGELVAVVQLLNKLKKVSDPTDPLEERVDMEKGFTEEEERLFEEFAPSIRLILESSKSFYKAIQRQRAAEALMTAIASLSKSSLDLEDTLKQVMDEAKELMNADRSTLWLLDEERGVLWTKIDNGDGTQRELSIPKYTGFAWEVARTGEPLLIPFDLYDDPRSATSKEFDKTTKYRTCSLLCMPVYNNNKKLIGVTQLVNKIKQGEYPPYNPDDWPHAPDCWKASFNSSDREFMEAFNIQAGIAIQNAKLFATVKQQEQMQRDILRSLTDGVISVDREGRVIAANESALELLGFQQSKLIEGQNVRDLVRLKRLGEEDLDFSRLLDRALHPQEEKDRRQYYPDRSLLVEEEEKSGINITITSMSDVSDPAKVNGALVVLEDVSDEKQVKDLMYRYMTPEVAEALLASGDTGLGGKRKHVSVLFSDIRGYTTLTEKLQAEEVVAMLNQYFELMVEVVLVNKGTLDKYIGDAIMAVFGSPAPMEDHAWQAIRTALGMRIILREEFNDERESNNQLPINIGMGIHSDEVVSGNIGSSKRMELTSIGDGVNLASRLEGASKQYGTDLIISENTYKCYADRLVVRELDFITVKGKTEPVTIYEVATLRQPQPGDTWSDVVEIEVRKQGGEKYMKRFKLSQPLEESKQRSIDMYHKGREFYLQPSRTKLSAEDFIPLLERLEEMSEAEVNTLAYDDKEMLRNMLEETPLPRLCVILGEDTLKRLLSVENLEHISTSKVREILPQQLGQLTPRLLKRMWIAKLRQFSGAKGTQDMLESEAEELSTAKIKKLIDLARPLFFEKAKLAFQQAKEEFGKVLSIDPKNKAAKLYLERCLLFEQQPPSESWDGVWQLTEK